MPASRAAAPRLAVALACVLAALFSACASSNNGVPQGASEPDKYLFDHGTEALKAKKWIVAREQFTKLFDSYPQSAYRAEAKLGMGDAYLGAATTESIVLAANEFREFLTFYPTNRRADYAQFQLAASHLKQMRGPERDQTETKDAVKELETFLERYPNSSLADEGRAKLREAKDRISDSDYRVGLYYLRSRWYPGAIDRFKTLLKNDLGYTRRDAVYFYLAEALVKAEKKTEALPYYERLVEEFAASDFLSETKRRIEQLKVKAG